MITIIVSIIIVVAALAVSGYLYWRSQRTARSLVEKEKQMNRRMYELAILKELGDRIGYSLNIQKIIDIITGSLRQFIDYSAVSYMLLEPEKIIFKVDIERSVSKEFVEDIKGRMLSSLSALLDKEFKKDQVEETLTGAILVEELKEPVRSFFNIPLVIGDKVVGVLTVANTKAGLYKEEEMTILYKITQQASQAVTRLQDVVETERGKLNAMVESMAEGVVMTDKDYRIVAVNPAMKKSLGLPEDKEDISIFDFIDNLEGKFDIRGKLEESVKLDKVLTSDDVFINNRFFQILVSPVKSTKGMTAGETLGGVVIFHDITHEKEVERMREDFTSMMVHELRSPLDGIKKMSEMLRSGNLKEDEKTQNEFMQMIFQSSGEMLELVNDLLDVAKLEAGKFEVLLEPTDIREVITGRLSFYKTSAADAKLTIKTVIADDVPEKVKLDSRRVTQVLNNLISNALKFTKAGGTVTIGAFLHQAGASIKDEAKAVNMPWFSGDEKGFANMDKALIVAVTDTGVGIPASDVSKLFSKFKQFKAAATSEKKGTGLGLVISKGIVEAHKGKIDVGSKEGSGATFYFAIPIITSTEE